MAGSRSGWIRWRSNPGRPSASRLRPNMPGAFYWSPLRPSGPRHALCDGTMSAEAPIPLATGPEIECVRLFLLVVGAVGFPDEPKTAGFVEASRARVALEGEELQPIEAPLGDLPQGVAHAPALRLRQTMELIARGPAN